jgi:predicted RNA binding protein YcfA (HicA-like mRNA interferase family)
MPKKNISPRDLSAVLKQLGFREAVKKGSHVLFRHQRTNLIVSVPTGQPFVPLVVIRTIIRSLDYHEIASPRRFAEMLDVEI